jgi:predicted permease
MLRHAAGAIVLDLVSLTLPIFLLIGIGFAAVRSGFVGQDVTKALGFLVLNIAMPALILRALLGQDLRQTFNLSYIGVYLAASLVVMVGALLVLRLILGRGLTQSAIVALGSASSNSGFIGYPVAALAFGAPALTALPLTIMIENIVVIPLALALAEAGRQQGQPVAAAARSTLLRLLRMPLLLAIIAGTFLAAIDLHLPHALTTSIGMLADSAIACALLAVGGTLAGLAARTLGADILVILAGKLVLHPLLVWLGFVLVGGVPPGLMAAGIVIASAPMLTVYPIFGQRFGLEGLCAAALVVTTVAGFLTMTVVLGLVGSPEAPTPRAELSAASAPCPPAPVDMRRSAAADCSG